MTTLNHEQRKQASDKNTLPEFFYTYILQFDGGGFYVGSTANPAARWTEHAINGAEATAGKRFTVKLVQQFITRREAEYNEKRIQEALIRGVKNVEAMIDNFGRISQMLRPEKTFSQLQQEEQTYIRKMEKVFHHSRALSWNPGGFPPTTCGYDGLRYYSTQDWEVLKKMARDEDYTGNVYGRRVCRQCLSLAPQADGGHAR